MNKYLTEVTKRINAIDSNKKIYEVALIISKAFENKNKTYTFGTGHSHMFGEELYARAGGWNYIVPILENELTLSSHPFKSTFIERVPEFASVLLELYPIKKNDIIIITSNSGRNGLIVEMALRAKKIGATVIAVTSITHSSSISSRHASGKLLKDIADIVIDNMSPSGDATIAVNKGMTAPVSTISNVFIAHKIVVATLRDLDKKNIDYNLFISSNLDGQDERNKNIIDEDK